MYSSTYAKTLHNDYCNSIGLRRTIKDLAMACELRDRQGPHRLPLPQSHPSLWKLRCPLPFFSGKVVSMDDLSTVESRAWRRSLRCFVAQGVMKALLWIVLLGAAGYAAYKVETRCDGTCVRAPAVRR